MDTKWKSDFEREDRRMRLFGRIFAVMFVLVAAIITGIFITVGYLSYKVITDPNTVGSYVGEIVNGVKETVK